MFTFVMSHHPVGSAVSNARPTFTKLFELGFKCPIIDFSASTHTVIFQERILMHLRINFPPPPLISRNIFVREISFFFFLLQLLEIKGPWNNIHLHDDHVTLQMKARSHKNDFMLRLYVSRWHCTFYRRLIKILLHLNEILSLIWYFSNLQLEKDTHRLCSCLGENPHFWIQGQVQPMYQSADV